jgi:hypothetical protein
MVGAAAIVGGPLAVTNAPDRCQTVGGLPDPHCTPGVVAGDVTQANIDKTICISGFTLRPRRPPWSYTNPLKLAQMREYGLTETPGAYEEDHLISLQLGGDPRDPRNLWPEAYDPRPGASEKDVLETFLKREVCAHRMSLADAQTQIRTNWRQAYDRMVGKASPGP